MGELTAAAAAGKCQSQNWGRSRFLFVRRCHKNIEEATKWPPNMFLRMQMGKCQWMAMMMNNEEKIKKVAGMNKREGR
jgi:hypothetical protein